MARESLVSSPRHFWLPQTLVLPNNTQFQLSADLRVWLSELRHLYDFYGRFRFESSESESDSLMFLENKSDVKNYYNSVKRYIKDLNFDRNILKDRVSDKNCKKSLCEDFTDSVYSKDIGIDVISVKPIKAEGIKPVVIHDSYLKHSISTQTCVNMNSALQNSFLYSLDNVTWKSNPLYSSTLGGSCTNKSIFKMMCEEALNSAAAMCIESLLPREKSSTFRNKRKGVVFDSDCIYGSDEQCLNVGKIVSSKFNFDVVYSSELEVNTQNLCKCLCHGSFLSSECAKPQYSTSDNQIPLNDIGDSMQELLILLSDDDHSEEKQLFQLEFCTLIEELDVLANENSSEILYSNLKDLGNKPIHRINIFDDGYSGRPKPPVRKKKTLTKNKSLNLVDSCNNHLIGDSTSLIDNESECSVSLTQNLESFSSSDGSIRWESPADEMYVTFESHRYGSESDLASSDVTFATVNEEEFPSDSVSVGLSGTVIDSCDGASSSQPDSEGCPELKPPLIGVITEVEGASEVLQRERKSSVSSDIVAWKRDIFFSALDDSDEDYYIAMGPNKDGWFSSSDNEGRVYFFEENSNESSWTLPEASPLNNNKSSEEEQRGTTSSQQPSLPIAVPLAVRNLNRTAKSRSMVLTDRLVNVWKTTLRLSGKSKLNKMWRVVLSTGHTVAARCRSEDNSALPHSVPRNWPQLWDGHMCVLKEGPLNRTKITENGKRLRKNWATTHVVLTELFLLFFKDSKAFAAMKSSGARPELCVDLNGAFIDREDKVSSRKNVYMLNTVLGLQVLIQCDNHNIAEQWFAAIHLAIKNLPLGFDNSNRGLKGGRDLSRSESNTLDEPKKGSRIGRSKSVKLKHKDESMEDLSVSPADRQIKIRERLKKFFHRRPTMESLVKKGIWKDEPVFGCYLEQVCGAEFPRVPLFVQRCIHCIEQSEENLKTDGLYRASGNLSQVQKIRLQVDQNNYAILEQEEDVHVLTGALKLFFRELKQPLLPFHFFNKALKASTNHNQKEKLKDFREIVKALPMPNHDTLKFLLQHLLRVTEYEEFNRMEIPNLAIVFGPTLMWSEQESLNMAFDLMQQNLVIGYFLAEFDQIFR